MKHAAYCGTRNVYVDMEASAKALIANSDVDVVHFIIEDATFPHPLPDMIVCHDLSEQRFFRPDGPNMESRYTYMALMRVALCHVLPVDRVLALDTDTLVMRDVSAIWDMPIDDCYFAGVPEWTRTKDGLVYCNGGVILHNLAKMRDGKADECIEVLNRRRYEWPEQDVLNYLCQGRIHSMPSKYNSNWWTDKNAPNPAIKHYAGRKPAGFTGIPEVARWCGTSWDEVLRIHGSRQ